MVPGINEPFCVDRDVSRLLFDLSILLSCMKKTDNLNVLDFAGGSGWVSEYLNRAGYSVTLIDINPEILRSVRNRIQADTRLDSNRLKAVICDGHNLQFCNDEYFGNIVCFDSLHHMSDFSLVFQEMFRVLEPGGRASFAEPGAKHAESKETIEFIRKYKSNDSKWIERSIILDEIYEIASKVGFSQFRVKPFLLPSMADYSYHAWKKFASKKRKKQKYVSKLISFNWDIRVIFYFDKI